MSKLPSKIDNRKASHSQHPKVLKNKRHGGGKLNWGNPMDDVKYLGVDNQPIHDPDDPNFDEEENQNNNNNQNNPTIDAQNIENNKNEEQPIEYFQNFQSDIESLSAFKVKIEELFSEYLWDSDEMKFHKAITTLNCKQFHNQIPKMILWVTIASKKQEHFPITRQLLLSLYTTNIVTKMEFESAFRRLFHRLNELNTINSNAYITLIDFAEYCVSVNMINNEFFITLKKQTEFAKDPQRVERLKKHIKDIIIEFFSSGDINEAVRSVKEMDTPFYNHEMVKCLISMAFDRQNRERELASNFLCASVGDSSNDIISRSSTELAFSILLQRVEDYYKDVPDVLQLLSNFIGRAICDEVLPPAFLENVHLLSTDMGYAVINHVKKLLSGHGYYEKMLSIWGVNANKSISDMKNAINVIIKEYLVTRELNEALSSIQELNIPLFHHEIIKQLIPAVADFYIAKDLVNNNNNNEVKENNDDNNSNNNNSNDNNNNNNNNVNTNIDIPKEISHKSEQIQLAIDLIATAFEHNIITKEQIKSGFRKLRNRLSDMKLDSPLIEKYFNVISKQFDVIIINESKQPQPQQQQPSNDNKSKLIGSVSKEHTAIDQNIKDICNKIKSNVIERAKKDKKHNESDKKFVEFVPVLCKTQVVAGRNYFIKIRVNKNNFIHVRIWQKLDNSIELTDIQYDKADNDKLDYF